MVVHHTAGPPHQTVHDIHRYHRSIGWIGIGYNVIQHEDATWHLGRGLDRIGAHAKDHNSDTVGVCLTGNFETHPVPQARFDSLVTMCAHLCRTYGLTAGSVVGHNELPGAATLCPGRHMDMDALRSAVHFALFPPDPFDDVDIEPMDPKPPIDLPTDWPEPPPTIDRTDLPRGCLPLPHPRTRV